MSATILLVEDNEMNRDALSRLLRRQGYTVVMAEEAETGIRIAQENQPALILMDISLPGMDGHAAIRVLRGRPDTRRIPIIALTAHALLQDKEQALAAGADDFDTKPVELTRLLGKIKHLLGEAQ